MTTTAKTIPKESVGLRLCRIDKKDRLWLCEPVTFIAGFAGVEITLRRAAISGRVEVGGENKDHFADVIDKDGSMIETVALDAHSYRALKNHWMRCRVESHDP